MKRSIVSVLIVLMFLQGFSQREIITLSFSAKDSLTQAILTLDSISVLNLDEDCDTSLFDPVSVLVLDSVWPVGIGEPIQNGKGSFLVTQNMPNPFQGKTMVRVYLKNDSDLALALFDSQGKSLSDYQDHFKKGWHLFAISTSGSRLLFLRVSEDNESKTIKMISTGTGGEENRISCMGGSDAGQNGLKSFRDEGEFIFYLGNQLKFTAYADGYYESIIYDDPVSSESYIFSMLPKGFTCGSSITINHVTGDVAPVNKTVTYGTVNNIPGETSKCWITSNLGSDHQATAKSDATEASAGWYWQFNRMQGYKHDGTTRTPNTTWITSINENSDWTSANDPCTLELGDGWHIPTSTEWTNVDASGNWTNWNGPWNSALKMHAAGYLINGEGILDARGWEGNYWSSMQYSATSGRFLYLDTGASVMTSSIKAQGQSLRCISE